jgi:hypothetical protein
MNYFANGTKHRILNFHQINSMPKGCTISHVQIQAINRDLEPKKRSRSGWEVHLESKDQIFFRQDYASRIYLRQTYPPIPSSIHKFSRLVTGKQRQTYASRTLILKMALPQNVIQQQIKRNRVWITDIEQIALPSLLNEIASVSQVLSAICKRNTKILSATICFQHRPFYE